MRIAVIALTQNGSNLAFDISKNIESKLFLPSKFIKSSYNAQILEMPFTKNISMLFKEYEGLIFIMATGIVIRSISKYIVSKTNDPAIVVMDEKGNYIISLLSGHIGGANELAVKVSKITGGQAVITTATDVNNSPAADIISKKNNCYIENIENLKYINSTLANSETVALFTEYPVKNNREDIIIINPSQKYNSNIVISDTIYKMNFGKTLYLRPKILVLGIGCKKNTPYNEIKSSIQDFMNKNNKSIHSIETISSINIKSKEEGILEFCKNYNINYSTFTAEELNTVAYKFSLSEFVKNTVGVGNICETSGFLSSNKGKQIVSKTIYNGVTLALFQKEYNITI